MPRSRARVRAVRGGRVDRADSSATQGLIAAFDALVEQHRPQILRLAGSGVIPAPFELRAGLPSELDVLDCLARMAAGERPFEDWMRRNGRSEEEIAVVYAVIDAWLARQRGDRTSN